MKKIMSLKEFAENVCKYVRKALPEELSKAEVRTASLDICDGNIHTALLIIRPWNSITTGFCLNKQYEDYSIGNATAESTAASIINDKKLYCMLPSDGRLYSSSRSPPLFPVVVY